MLPLKAIRLTSDSPYTPAELIIQDVANKLVPAYLFKYRDTGQNTKKIFSQSKLWFSPPPLFNDPFDCQLAIDTTCTKQELQTFLKRNNEHYSRADIRRYSEIYHKNPALLRRVINDAARESLDNTGICCFGPDETNILMWSHYSESHKGLCLKFDVLADPELFILPFKVEYKDDYPKINHIKNTAGDSVKKIIETKSKAWEYENEWRVMKFMDAGLHAFDKRALVEVVFGCKASNIFIDEIVRLAQDNNFNHLVFKKARPSKSRFSISIKSL